jgi:hypothetical protein
MLGWEAGVSVPPHKYAWLALRDVTIFDAKLETQKLLPLGRGAMNMAFCPDGCTPLTGNYDAGNLAVVDLERAEVLRTVPPLRAVKLFSCSIGSQPCTRGREPRSCG